MSFIHYEFGWTLPDESYRVVNGGFARLRIFQIHVVIIREHGFCQRGFAALPRPGNRDHGKPLRKLFGLFSECTWNHRCLFPIIRHY